MRVLIVAKTHMGSGACIGAITEKGESVRLIPFNANPRDGANKEYGVGDIWKITAEPETSLIPPHNENIVVHKKHRLHTTKDMKDLESTIELLMPPETGNPLQLYEGLLQTTSNDRLYIAKQSGIPPYSTTFWRTDQPLTLETEEQKLRYRYPTENGGCMLTFSGFQKPLETIPAGTLIRVSLAGWWRPENTPSIESRCYAQISGWFLEGERQEKRELLPENRQAPPQSKKPSLEVLKNVFGHEQFLPFQEEIIEHIRKGEDGLVVLPTGGGKSLCYQLPACIFDGLTVVVSPLIALMEDQVMQLEQKGIRAAFLNHILEREKREEYIATMQKVRSGKIKLLYISPERLVQRPEIHVMLYDSDVACLAIDEAHCIAQWGHDFRPNYRELDWVREQFPKAVCIATTATATPRVQKDIKQSLNFSEGNEFINSFDRENLFISVEPRFELLGQTLAFLKKHAGESGIIYCQKRKHVDWLCENLKERGISVLPYHAGLDNETRTQNQDAFINGNIDVIVATIAFGMGIDKPDVRFVLHAWLPQDPESYYQQIGRSGRDGERAECLLLFSHDDVDTINEFIDDSHPSQHAGGIERLQTLVTWANSTACRRKELLAYFEEEYETQNCGMCDNCLKAKIDQVDLTTPAQKFLSCLYRVLDWINKNDTNSEEVFDKAYFVGTLQGENTSIPICLPAGALYIIDLLRGEKQEKIIKNKPHKLIKTWGEGKEYSKVQWCYLALQFFQNNLYQRDSENGSLHLTDKGRKINTRKPIAPDDQFWGFPVDLVDIDLENSVIVELDTYEPDNEQYDYDPVLFERLCHKRRNIAEEELTQASRILRRDSLKEMATQLPQTADEFNQIRGIGKVKMKYADDFLTIIRAYCEEHEIDSVESVPEVTNTYEPVSEESDEHIPALFEKLRAKRKELAEAEQIQASRVMTIDSLKKMAIQLPQSAKAFRQIKGIGKVRMRYVDDFLPIIRDYCKEHRIDSTETKTGGLNTNDATSKKRDEYAHDLFEQLQDKCKTLEEAEQEGIFTDGTLREMATSLPRTREAFGQIRGISLRKMEKYADDFLPIIRAYCEEHGID
ncbi:hypothetical protein C6499_23120 [Candidatus Poribacteria bacterium]|nr:MAG: hypothetical protein C6499_23120 [Candidatus Poribacteria bacterium]